VIGGVLLHRVFCAALSHFDGGRASAQNIKLLRFDVVKVVAFEPRIVSMRLTDAPTMSALSVDGIVEGFRDKLGKGVL